MRPQIRRVVVLLALAYSTVLGLALIASAVGPLAGTVFLLVPGGLAVWAVLRPRMSEAPIESITPVGRTWFWILVAGAQVLLLAARRATGR